MQHLFLNPPGKGGPVLGQERYGSTYIPVLRTCYIVDQSDISQLGIFSRTVVHSSV